MIGTLSEIEPIRNKIAHNRKATDKDVVIVRGALSKLSTTIGPIYFDSLVSRCTLASDIPEQLINLKREAKNSWLVCHEYKPLDELTAWNSVSTTWWFDDSYLGEKIDKIEEFFHIIEEYSHIPRSRGIGHKIESWVRSSTIDTKHEEAEAQFDAILVNA